MGSLPAQDPDTGGTPRRYLLVSDTHYHERDRDDVDTLHGYLDAFDCDELLVAGDVGRFDDVEALLDADVEAKVARGNHDVEEDGEQWLDEHASEEGELLYRDGDGTVYGDEIRWLDGPDLGYTVGMAHKPHAFGIRAMAKGGAAPDGSYDILLYGHSHMPHYRVLGDGTLAIGAGSAWQNYHTMDDLPDRSVQVVEIGEKVRVEHIDVDTDDVVEELAFAYTVDGFELVEHDADWGGVRFTA